MYKLDVETISIFNEVIQDLINSDQNEDLYLCPAGDMSKEIYNLALKSGVKIKGFIDKNRGGEEILSKSIFSFVSLEKINPKKIIVCHDFYDKEIYNDLEKIDFGNVDTEIINLTECVRKHFYELYREQFKEKNKKYNQKILLCRARGGFNDALSQITKCLAYAQKYDRALYVDTTRSGFLDCYSNYFETPDLFEFGSPDKLNHLAVFPTQLQGRLNEYVASQRWEYSIKDGKKIGTLSQYCDNLTGTEVTFDFSKDYEEDLLVHEQEGRTHYAVVGLETLKVKKGISIGFMNIIKELGVFQGVHIRNTDFKTDYKSYLDELSIKIEGRILFCTDDYTCLAYAKKAFGKRLFSVSDIPDTKGAPLHGNKNIERYKTNLDSLRDLFVLSSADKVYSKTLNSRCLEIGENVIDIDLNLIESGFSILAKNLCRDKSILFDILNEPNYLMVRDNI